MKHSIGGCVVEEGHFRPQQCMSALPRYLIHDERGQRWSSKLIKLNSAQPVFVAKAALCKQSALQTNPYIHSKEVRPRIHRTVATAEARASPTASPKHRLCGHSTNINSSADEGIHNARESVFSQIGNLSVPIVRWAGRKMGMSRGSVQKPLGRTHHSEFPAPSITRHWSVEPKGAGTAGTNFHSQGGCQAAVFQCPMGRGGA